MTKTLLFAGAVLGLCLGATAASADELTHGVNYGSGNDYTPGEWTITSTDGVEEGLRAHIPTLVADAPVGDVYAIALNQIASFDFAIDPSVGRSEVTLTDALITITNRAGGSASFNPFFLGGNGSTAPGDINNSERLSFGFLNGAAAFNVGDIHYDAGKNATYDVVLSVTEASGAVVTDQIVIQQGTGGVPEPASWALMIVGFGAAGAMLRRRQLRTA